MSVDALIPEVRGGLAVSASYDDEKIPALIRRTCRRLLRDYNFPKQVVRISQALAIGDSSLSLGDGFKKELEVRIHNPEDYTWTDPLRKRQGFQLPYPSGVPTFYWIEGQTLFVDTPFDEHRVGFELVAWAQTMDVAAHEDWLTNDFADAVLYASIVRGCAEFRKPEVMQTYAPLWTDEQTSLAIYLNELEWNNMDVHMNEARRWAPERYPIS